MGNLVTPILPPPVTDTPLPSNSSILLSSSRRFLRSSRATRPSSSIPASHPLAIPHPPNTNIRQARHTPHTLLTKSAATGPTRRNTALLLMEPPDTHRNTATPAPRTTRTRRIAV